MSELDLELVRHALSVARQYGFAEVEVGLGERSFSARLDPAPVKKTAAKTTDAGPAESEFQTLTATLVGYYREAKNPLRVGAQVKKGDVIAIVSALGLLNDVESKHSGEVVEVLVEPDQAVEYGQVLARVKI